MTPNPNARALRVVLAFAAFGGLWIYFSDEFAAGIATGADAVHWLGTAQGIAFAAVTAGVLYALIARELRAQQRLLARMADTDSGRQAMTQRLAGILERMNDGFVALDRDLRFLYVNRRAAETFQRQGDDLLGKRLIEEFPGPVGEAVQEVCKAALRDQTTVARQKHYPTLGRWFEENVYPTPDGVSVVFHDVTARRRSEEKLRQAAMVFESTHDGVAITDLEANILAINHAFTDITGYTELDALGTTPRLLKSDRHGPEFYEKMWQSLMESGNWQGEIWNRRKDGDVCPQWLTISTVRDSHGKPTHYVAVLTDIGPLRRREAEVEQLAHFDSLTDLPNRLMMQARLESALGHARRHGHRAAVLYVDLDRFKTINESLGHAAGDELLVAVTQRLRERLRSEDVLGRLGGDEFMVIVEPVDQPEDAAVLARDLLASLEAAFKLSSGQEVYIGASIGISVFPMDGATPSELLRAADSAAYRAKEEGRNRFCLYTEDMNAAAMATLATEAALRRAIERGEFHLHYQPKVDLKTGRITGAEALLRWRREDGTVVPPGQFIPIAEKNGLIVAIGEWVIDAACRQMRMWREQGMVPPPVAVNVSAVQLRSGKLDDVVAAALKRHDIYPNQLELELTESALMEHPDEAAALLGDLKKIGVRISLDDFGTGFSSLAQLLRLPIDCVKIDRSFVTDVAHESDAATVANLIIDMAHRLRLRVVAEGIETEAQLGYLRSRDCDEMQGFFFSQPVLPDAFAEQVKSGRSLPALPPAPGARRTLLLVDDEPSIVASLRRLLRDDGYEILNAANARDALDLLASSPVQVILSDQRMPGMTGVEFLTRVRDLYPDTVRIVLSGYYDVEQIVRAVNDGAIHKFLTKPWDDDLLRQHIADAFRYQQEVVRPRPAPPSGA